MGNAQALRGDEGRDKLRKAAGIGTYELIRGYPNGATRHVEDMASERRRTRGTETSKYPEEEKTKVIPLVVASERGLAQTGVVTAMPGLQDCDIRYLANWNRLERRTVGGDSPVQASEVEIAVS
eukprot:TRINITY_DN302_c0_g3_i2.p4 TRINITY_DN302_c0_g3~~TRINITY_DN302_c0_g3_i2.p4  ORF type:complete len:124 (+),score=24.25 TRINITY_DN302_c0_g3_i2:135-506(+)